ncbi:MAG: hypothetical protein HY876_09435 [Coriobacteriales bacterium]|nr:hypothetical protein [Coriobacteriales bacterium]
MRRPVALVAALVCALLIAALLPSIAAAAAFRSGDTVTVGPNETIDDDLYISGNHVRVLGTVNGDVIAAGQVVEVRGKVSDDVMAAAQSVRVGGDVGGTVRVAGSDVSVESTVTRDVMAAGSAVDFARNAVAQQDAFLAGATVTLAGRVGRDAAISGGSVVISGNIGDDVTVDADTLKVESGARIRSNLSYSAEEASVQGTVTGATERRPSRTEQERERKAKERSGKAAGAFFFWAFVYWVRALIGYVIFGLIAVLVFRRFSADSSAALARRPWPALGWGALVVFVFPMLFVPTLVLGIIIGGWWIAVLALFAWFTLLAMGVVIGALTLGRLIISRGAHPPHDVWAMLLGLLILWVVGIVPFVGVLAIVVAMIFGVGGVILAISTRRAERRAAEAEASAAAMMAQTVLSGEAPVPEADAQPPSAGK